MIDIAVLELNKYYGSNHVLKGITFDVNSGEKVGLLGKNGSGKTTLFKTLTGEETYEGGNISKAAGKRVEMLAQIPAFGDNDIVEEILRSSFQEITDIYAEMKSMESDLSPDLLARYGHLLEEYERLGGYELEVKLEKICRGMNLEESLRESAFHQLSGGEKTRVNLARILLRDCDILLLDEPTNHLDVASLEWLEKFLQAFAGTLIVISHDRLFLDRVVTRIIEMEDGKADFYCGNYSFYAQEKQRRVTLQSQQYERQQKEIKRIEERAKWFVLQNQFTTKHHAILSRIDHMEKVEKPTTSKALTGEFDGGGYAAKEVVSFDSVCKSFGQKVLLRNANLQILRNDRIALVGANGCGKTTIMKMLMNEELPDSGNIKRSVSAKPAYMPQLIEFAYSGDTVLDTFRVATGASEEKARSILAGFHFRAADVSKRVGTLSGGEKSRLKLCLLMQNSVNFLLLDEPTNHLDIASREWIENALSHFDGTMLFVSHDRYFLRKFATKIWSMENGSITPYDCGFEEYLEVLRNPANPTEAAPKKPRQPKTAAQTTLQKNASMESRIKEAEAELQKLQAEIERDVSSADFSKMNELFSRKNQLEEQMEALYSQWLGGDEE